MYALAILERLRSHTAQPWVRFQALTSLDGVAPRLTAEASCMVASSVADARGAAGAAALRSFVGVARLGFRAVVMKSRRAEPGGGRKAARLALRGSLA